MVTSDQQLKLSIQAERTIIQDLNQKDTQAPLQSGLMEAINRALKTEQEQEVCETLHAAIKTKNVTRLSIKSGNNRTTLYRAFQPGAHPNLSTVLRVLKSLDLRLDCSRETASSIEPGSELEANLVSAELGGRTGDFL